MSESQNKSPIEKISLDKGLWLFISPIYGVDIDPDFKKNITINKITIVPRSRIKNYIRYKTKASNNETFKSFFFKSNLFNNDENIVYAIAELGGFGKDKEVEFIRELINELHILSLSQLSYSRRRHNASPTLILNSSRDSVSYVMFNTTTNTGMAPNELIGYFDPLLIDKSWYDFHKEMYFIKLLDCIKNKNNLSDGWHKNICDAAILAGKSQSTNDIAQAFLLNMIAIETLLTGTNDSYSKALPKRVEAFIGWTTSWQSESYQKKISECYSKRCKYVHAGEAEQISVRDLLFSDIIISNVFYNIILNIKIFNCKQDIIEFSEKIEAEKILGIKSKIRSKKIKFIKPLYNAHDYEHRSYL